MPEAFVGLSVKSRTTSRFVKGRAVMCSEVKRWTMLQSSAGAGDIFPDFIHHKEVQTAERNAGKVGLGLPAGPVPPAGYCPSGRRGSYRSGRRHFHQPQAEQTKTAARARDFSRLTPMFAMRAFDVVVRASLLAKADDAHFHAARICRGSCCGLIRR